MRPLPILSLSVALAVIAGVLTQIVARPAPEPAAAGAAPIENAAPSAEVRALAAQMERLAAEMRALSERVDSAALADTRAPEVDLESVVRRVLEEELPALSASAASARDAEPVAEVSVDALLDEILRADLAGVDSSPIWERARAAGKTDELVKAFELRAEERPEDPAAQLDVGNAYLQKIFDVAEGPERGLWATRADQAFDRALALDPQHWEARFTKAVSLSFWPPLFGKQAEAIRHFEILVEQQRAQPLSSQHAQTYELLGNLYQQMGKGEKALETWRAGAQLFPGDEGLAAKASESAGG